MSSSPRKSSGRRARTRAIRAYMATTDESFTHAAARSAGPWPGGLDPADESYEFEMLGRVVHELWRGAEPIANLYTWTDHYKAGGRDSGFVIEWSEGPYAHEVHEILLRVVADPDRNFRLPYEITSSDPRCARPDRTSCNIVIGGVPFLLRAYRAIGKDAAFDRSLAKYRPDLSSLRNSAVPPLNADPDERDDR